MANRNWGQITNGATFESLATTLLFFEDSKAALLVRRGKDGGQDARSSDGKRVFQAKHHQDGSAAKAIADAKKEAKKIAKYRTLGHLREPQWRGVTHWRLVTNAAFNTTDRQTWDSVVVPLFHAQSLVADYWEQANLDALLDKHPEVDRAYFQNETRVFLSLPEVREMLPNREPFLRRNALGTFFGRDTESRSLRSFLESNQLFLVIHGAGGVGKTRVALEAGERIATEGAWQVLWVNVASMKASGTWFNAIAPECQTLLIVDEPKDEDEKLLHVLTEQLGSKSGRTSQWKIAIIVRSPKDPVLKFLSSPGIEHLVERLCVAALPQSDAESMCIDLINSGTLANTPSEWRVMAGKELAKRFSSHPVWLTLAVHLLESTGDLTKVPEKAEGLAKLYLSEITNGESDYDPETVTTLLRWVALVGTLDRENDTTIKLIAQQAQLSDSNVAREALASLVRRKALAERGARGRFVEVKPDVLRDYLLLKWLSVDVGHGSNPVQPSGDAKQLAKNVLDAMLGGEPSAVGRVILTLLARTEFVLSLSGQAVPLLGSFMQDILKDIGKANVSTQMAIAEAFVDFAAYRPEDTVKLSQLLRTLPCVAGHVDGIFGTRDVGHDDVILELAWPVYHAAFGAQSPEIRQLVLKELCELVKAESCVATRRELGLPNDGKRAKDLIGRTIEGGPQFWSDFEDEASATALSLLDEIADHAPDASCVDVLKALVGPATSAERQQTWSEGHTIHIQTSTVLPEHPAWKTREALKTKIKVLLKRDETPQGTRLALWTLLAEAHQSLSLCRTRSHQDVQTTMRQEMLDDLTWARSVLTQRSCDLDESSAARDLWDWYVRFEKNRDLLKSAECLEKIYMENKLAAEFKGLQFRDEPTAWWQRVAARAAELASAEHGAIDAFLDRAAIFFKSEKELNQVSGVAAHLGQKADESESVRSFIFSTLGESEVLPRADFAAIAGNSWAEDRRQREPSSTQTLVVELTNACGSDTQKLNVLQRLYGQLIRLEGTIKLTDEEFVFIRSHEKLFVDAKQAPEFITCVAWGLDFEWTTLKSMVERVLDAVPNEQIVAALYSLANALFWALYGRDPEEMPSHLGTWMLDQLLRVPNIDRLGKGHEWSVNEVLKRVGKVPLTWLPEALRRRRDMETQCDHEDVLALSHRMRLSQFVDPIDQDSDIDGDSRAAVYELLDLVSDTGSVGHFLHEILRDVDPHGRVVPAEVARRFTETDDRDDQDAARRLARIGGGFALETPAWRTIAKPVLARAANADEEERGSLYLALTDLEPRSWPGTPGEVPAIFTSAVESARQHLKAETDDDFRPLWEWCLTVAEADLRGR